MNLINTQFDSLNINQYGTENMSLVLYSLVRFAKPKKLLEVGMGHSTLFLAYALKDIKLQIESQPLNHRWLEENFKEFKNEYNPVLDVIDDLSEKHQPFNYYQNLLKENNLDVNVNLVNSEFWDFYNSSDQDYDFIWFDAGCMADYYLIMQRIYPNLVRGGIIVFHNTVSTMEEKLFETTLKLYSKENKLQDLEIITIAEPHKRYQNSFTICKKSY